MHKLCLLVLLLLGQHQPGESCHNNDESSCYLLKSNCKRYYYDGIEDWSRWFCVAEGIQVSRQGNKYPECAVKNDDDDDDEELRRQPR